MCWRGLAGNTLGCSRATSKTPIRISTSHGGSALRCVCLSQSVGLFKGWQPCGQATGASRLGRVPHNLWPRSQTGAQIHGVGEQSARGAFALSWPGQATNSGVLQSRKLFACVVSSRFFTPASDSGGAQPAQTVRRLGRASPQGPCASEEHHSLQSLQSLVSVGL